MNKNVVNTRDQILNTLEVLEREKIIDYFNMPEITENINDGKVRITWENHVGGRSVSSKAFLTIKQYLTILESNAYHALMYGNSIIRCSFEFENDKLVSQNLLWWPCPIEINKSLFNEYNMIEIIKEMLENTIAVSDIKMRTPIRIDFDVNNNTTEHPRAHAHMQHHESRINTNSPICFNRFMKFILVNFYPEININTSKWNMLNYQYNNKHTSIEYVNKTSIVI